MQKTGATMEDTKITPPTLVVNEMTLVWSEDYKRFMLPEPVPAPMHVLYDEPTGKFLPVMNPNHMLFRAREATATDGTVLREWAIFQSPVEVTQQQLDQQRLAIEAKKLQFRLELWETITHLRPVFIIGFVATLTALFGGLAYACLDLGPLLATAAGAALVQVVGYAVWVVGALGVLGILKLVLPALMRPSKDASLDLARPTSAPVKDSGNVIINVQRDNGTFGAQSIIHDRK